MPLCKQPSEMEVEAQVHLYGHTGEVTSLFVCKPYSVLISVSKDGTCILWDLNRWVEPRPPRPSHQPFEPVHRFPAGSAVFAELLANGSGHSRKSLPKSLRLGVC